MQAYWFMFFLVWISDAMESNRESANLPQIKGNRFFYIDIQRPRSYTGSAEVRAMATSAKSDQVLESQGLRLPNVCCGCLGRPEASLKVKGVFYESTGLATYTESERSIDVPICRACAARQASSRTARWIISAMCGLVFLALGFFVREPIMGAMGLSTADMDDVLPYHIATFVWGFILGLIPGGIIAARSRLVSIDKAGRASFRNPEYQRLYADLNP
jgi:hypothetical protein